MKIINPTILTLAFFVMNQFTQAQCGPNKVPMHICINHKCQNKCVEATQVSYYQSMGYSLGKCTKNNSCIGPIAMKEDISTSEPVLAENHLQSFLNPASTTSPIWQVENNSEKIYSKNNGESFLISSRGGCHCKLYQWGCKDWEYNCIADCYIKCNQKNLGYF